MPSQQPKQRPITTDAAAATNNKPRSKKPLVPIDAAAARSGKPPVLIDAAAARNQKPVVIIDAAAVINDEHFSFSAANAYFATPEIISELKDSRSKALVDNALMNRILKILEPSTDSLRSAKDAAKELGMQRLSAADISLIALAIEMRSQSPLVITDDYSVQNLLKFLGINFRGAIQPGITKLRRPQKPLYRC